MTTKGSGDEGRGELRCSFCNKSQRHVQKLIAGPNVQICDECVDICVDIMKEERKDLPPSGTVRDVPIGNSAYADLSASHVAVACSLCHMVVPLQHTIAVHSRGVLCVGCIGAVEGAIAAARKHRGNR